MMRLGLMALAVLSAIAGTMLYMINNQTNLLPENLGGIAGTGCFMMSGMFWMMYGVSYGLVKHDRHNDKISK